MAVAVLAATAAVANMANVAAAQAFPDKPIKLVVPFPPGGGADNLARAVIPRAGEILGQPITIENRPGAGGNVGSEAVARSPADGYTLLYGTNGTHGINHALYAKPGFDPIKDFATVSRVSYIPAMLVVIPSVPAGTLKELVEYLRANPGKVSFASAGNGTTSHMAGELFKRVAAVEIQHIPYKGGGPALTGLLGGEVQMMIDLTANLSAQVKAGKLKAIAVTSSTRVPGFDLPTLQEAGLAGYEIIASDGIFAPAGTPRAVVEKLNAAMKQALSEPAVIERLTARGAVAIYSTPEAQLAHITKELPQWARLVKESGAKVD
ncbi:MAG: tripartite tricarboxylate transporter substrate binding protein [Burkholderiales bacterium]|nr:tripartite tricarboxylate transporter substrate binding protein [Burkholderiales bacterium]